MKSTDLNLNSNINLHKSSRKRRKTFTDNNSFEEPKKIKSNKKKPKLNDNSINSSAKIGSLIFDKKMTFAPSEEVIISKKFENILEASTSAEGKNINKRSNSKTRKSKLDSNQENDKIIKKKNNNNNKNFELSSTTQNILNQILSKEKPDEKPINIKFDKNTFSDNINDFLTPTKFMNTHNFSVNNSTKTDIEKSVQNTNTKQKSKKGEISSKTLELINQMKTERKNRFLREPLNSEIRKRSESSFSMRFKYEELTNDERTLILPAKYKSIYNSFCELDDTLNAYKIGRNRNKLITFDELSRSIVTTYRQ